MKTYAKIQVCPLLPLAKEKGIRPRTAKTDGHRSSPLGKGERFCFLFYGIRRELDQRVLDMMSWSGAVALGKYRRSDLGVAPG